MAASVYIAKPRNGWAGPWHGAAPDRWTSGVDWLAIEAKTLEE